MDEPPDPLVEQALQHQLNARACPVLPSSAFLLTTKPEHTGWAKTAPPPKKSTIKAVERLAENQKARYPVGENEARKVFSVQLPTCPTKAIYSALQNAAGGTPPLPGGVPLVDHLKARVYVSRDFHELGPHIEEMRGGRQPKPEDTTNSIELTLGVSKPAEWAAVTATVKEILKSDTLYPFMGADTESSPVAVTWDKHLNESTFDTLMANIALDAFVENNKIEFTIATSGQSACSLPTRFFFGTVDKHFHIRLPTTTHRSKNGTKLILDMDTIICEEAKELFRILPSMVGAGITDDYLKWAKITTAIWNDPFFESVAKPIELSDLAKIARINIPNSSIFHLNWYIFGTVLPKHMASLGDSNWAISLAQLPLWLRMYLSGDITQPVRMASVLCLIIILQTVPDLTVVRDASEFTALGFIRWFQTDFLGPLVAGWTEIQTDSIGRWSHINQITEWRTVDTLEEMVNAYLPRSAARRFAFWQVPDWPAITSGGPRSIHQVRDAFIDLIACFRHISPSLWMEDYHEKKTFWRFGHSSAAAKKPLNCPVQTHKFHCGPGLENRLPPNPLAWTKADFTLNVIPEVRGEKAIVLEFMRVHPDRAHAVHELAVNHITRFKTIFTSKRVVKSVADFRKMLRFLNIQINIPNPDPYREVIFKSSKAERAAKHQQLLLTTFKEKQERYAKKALEAQKALESALSQITSPSQEVPAAPISPDQSSKRSHSEERASSSRKVVIRDEPPAPGLDREPARRVIFREDQKEVEARTISWVEIVQEDEEEALRIQLEESSKKAPAKEEEDEIKIVAEVKKIETKDERTPATPTPPYRPKPLTSKANPITFPVIPLLQPNQLPPILDFTTPALGPIQEPGAFTPEISEFAENVYLIPENEAVRVYNGATLYGIDYHTLKSPKWLNDQVITAYLYLIQERSEHRTRFPKVYSYPSYIYTRLTTCGYANMTDGFLGTHNIFLFELVFFPIGMDSHWVLAAIDNRYNTISIYDSLPCHRRASEVLNQIITFVNNEHFRLFDRPMRRRYTLRAPRNIPFQTNGVDCGIFVCLYAEHLARLAPFNFTQASIWRSRLIITYELYRGILLTDA